MSLSFEVVAQSDIFARPLLLSCQEVVELNCSPLQSISNICCARLLLQSYTSGRSRHLWQMCWRHITVFSNLIRQHKMVRR